MKPINKLDDKSKSNSAAANPQNRLHIYQLDQFIIIKNDEINNNKCKWTAEESRAVV